MAIYKALCFDVAQGQMNGAPNETHTSAPMTYIRSTGSIDVSTVQNELIMNYFLIIPPDADG